MDQYLNNRQKEVLLRLLANPADSGGAYLSNLQELVKLYPQSGLFRALYGRALNETSPLVAGAYFDSRALHKLLYHHDNIAPISNDQVVVQADGKLFGGPFTETNTGSGFVSQAQIAEVDHTVDAVFAEHVTTTQEIDETGTDFAEPVETPLEETLPEYQHEEIQVADEAIAQPFEPAPWEVAQAETTPELIIEEEEPLGRAPWELDEDEEDEAPVATQQPEQIIEPAPAEEEPIAETYQEPVAEPAIDTELADKLAYWASLEDEYDAPNAQVPQPVVETPAYYEQQTPINEQVYDEITSIDDIGLEQINIANAEAEEQQATQEEADRLIMGNIAATDFFTFDKAFGDAANRTVPEPEQPAAPESTPQPMYRPHPESATPSVRPEPAHQPNDVAKYHDEKMPYTFMWWLDKTRREHGSLYQPYAKAPAAKPANDTPRKTRTDELQQQYFENIFHLSAEDLVTDAAQTIEFDMQSKEDRIIQRFITEDPHIHPPVGEKLNTENKAKKSSEDGYDMVTETLARIYADQMLFPKAIATYKKLMLKYPEKSRYFASRIENLEKRTN